MSEQSFTVEVWDIDKIIPYEKNAKIHSEEQVNKLATAIGTFGWSQPIIVDKDGVIIAGHGRRLAAIKLGRPKVPVICRRDLNKSEANALRLADNRVASTEYDMALIQEELRSFVDDESITFELTDIGFDAKELDFSLSDLGEMSDDFFVTDVSGAVEAQKTANRKAAEAVDDTTAPAVDALGFKRVTIAQSRSLRELMSRAETKSGKSGADALIAILSASV